MQQNQSLVSPIMGHQKEQLFKSEQQKFDAIFFGSASPLVLYLGPEFVFEKLNQKYLELYPKRELLGKRLTEALPELQNSPFPAILKKVYETGESYFSQEGLVRIYNPNNEQLEERYFDTTFSRIHYGGDEPYRIMATPREVTDRVLVRKKLEISLRELQQERDLREKFVSALSHDLRTPLSIAKICTQLIRRKSENIEAISTMAERIVVHIDRADRMIRDLLDANRIKASEGIPISIRNCRLNLILDYVVTNLEELYGKRFQIHKTPDEVDGYWDEMAIHRIIENLASNAIKYGSAETAVLIAVTLQDNWIEISVHNKGTPIPADDQKSLFNHYHRTNLAANSGQKGWGIGLTLVRGLTEAHGGMVRIESNDEHGTSFIVRLPVDARQKS